jgi:hypothetical protein
MAYEDDRNNEALQHILAGKSLKSVGQYISRDRIACELSRWIFNDRVPIGFRMGSMKMLIELLGYTEPPAKEKVDHGEFPALALDIKEKATLGTETA